MSTPDTPVKEAPAVPPANPDSPTEAQEQDTKAEEVAVEITDIKASGLPAKVGLFGGLFYVTVTGGKVPQKTKKVKYTKGDEFVASWDDTVKLSGLESSKVGIEVYARRFPFFYKVIKKTESKANLAELIEQSEMPVELELLEEGKAAGKLVFKISRSPGGEAKVEIPPVSAEDASEPAPPASSTPSSPEQVEQAS